MKPYQVKTLRDAGLEAKWSKTPTGAPIIVARNPNSKLAHQREKWWFITARAWKVMSEVGIIEGFDRETLLGDVFSI